MGREKEIAVIDNGAVYIIQPGTKVYLKTSDVASMFGVSNQWIGQLVSQGTLNKKRTARGAFFDNDETVRNFTRDIQAKAQEKAKTADEIDRLQFENSIKKAKATIATMEAKELLGKMHRSEDVAAMTEDLIYSIRGMLLALPGRLADDVHSAETSAEAESIIRSEVYAVMEAISRYQYDPRKYEERVRGRKSWDDSLSGEDDDD